MSRRTKRQLLAGSLAATVAFAGYAFSWSRIANTAALYSFAADEVSSGRLDQLQLRPVILLQGFGQATSAELLHQRMRDGLATAEREVRTVSLPTRAAAP
jgi:hypothetical protein